MSDSSEFQQNPITFLRKHALSPPDGTAGDVIKKWSITTAGNVISGGGGGLTTDLNLRKAGVSRHFCDFKKHGLLPGCLTVSLSKERTSENQFCQHWLPWDSLAITKHKLPPIPGSIVGGSEDEDEFPRFFMTAGINGCSVFVDGPATSPTIYHAGITGKLARPSDGFWREQLTTAFEGTTKQGQMPTGQVHSKDYMLQDSPAINRYIEWASSTGTSPFRMEVTSCFGSIVGVRFGRSWSFYLQENVFLQDIELVKRSQLTSGVNTKGDKFYKMKGSGEMVERQVTVQKRKVLPDLRNKLFLRRTNQRCVPVRVSEIYPTRTFHGELKDLEVRAI